VLLAKGADMEAKMNVSVTPIRTESDAPTREAAHKHARETPRPQLTSLLRRPRIVHSLA
jgi:hypothetical protein